MGDGYRFDGMSGDWVAVVPGRQKAHRRRSRRPVDLPEIDGRCPFCPGNEAETEASVAVVPESGPWRIRVVDNLYPLASRSSAPPAPERACSPLFRRATGAHEVLIEHPAHDLDLPDYSEEHLLGVVRMYRDRARTLGALAGVASVAVFRNRGRRAGSSQPHPHGQIVATPVPAPRALRRQALAAAHYGHHGETLLAAQLADERAAGGRLVLDHGEALAFVPYAPRQNHHIRVAVAGATGLFGDADDGQISAISRALGEALRRLRGATGGVPYNVLFESGPVATREDRGSFWFVDVLPRRGGPAGFEHSTGIDVVTEDPEGSAAMLREVSLD